jgi:hypothetical protein
VIPQGGFVVREIPHDRPPSETAAEPPDHTV